MDKELFKKAIKKWGVEAQIDKLQEELLELALVLTQIKCITKDPKVMQQKLYDELADVKIMMAQSDLLFDSERINNNVEHKLDGLRNRLL